MWQLLRIRDDSVYTRPAAAGRGDARQMPSHRKAPIQLTIFSLRTSRLAGLALVLAFAMAFVRVPVEAAATVDGQFAELGMRGAGVTTVLAVAGRGGVPGDAGAVTLNVTSTGSVGAGFATVYPCGTPRPDTSNINFAAGSTVANAVTSKVGADGTVCVYTHAATHLIVDVNGYFPRSADFGALVPARLLDTRRSSPAAVAEDAALLLTNQLRASRGLGPVAPDATMTAFAQNWSVTMSQSGFRHSGGPYVENVGWLRGASSAEAAALGLHNAFLASPAHLANMVNPAWTTAGVGVHTDGSTWYITLVFR
jgi:uncharacterized protein YkwD